MQELSVLNRTIQKTIQLESELLENEGVITLGIQNLIDDIKSKSAETADTLALLMERLEASIAFYKSKEAEIVAVRRSTEKHLGWLKENVKQAMLAHGIELEGDSSTIKVRENPVSVLVENMDLIPDEFKSTEVIITADKKKIAEILKFGQDVLGAKLIRNTSLSIKPKKLKLELK